MRVVSPQYCSWRILARRFAAPLTFALALGVLFSALSFEKAFADETPEELFQRANTEYDSTGYIEAIADYNKILARGQESPELYYNLGNTYFESGDLGHAILNYLRAQRLDPTDDDIRANLDYARSFVTIQLEGVELNPVTEFFSALTGRASLALWGWLTTCALFLLCGVLLYRIVDGASSALIQSGAIALFVIFVALTSLTTFKYRHEFAADRAVVTIPEVAVTDRPSKDGDVEFKAAAGLEVVIRERSGNFALALFANKRQGWITTDALERL